MGGSLPSHCRDRSAPPALAGPPVRSTRRARRHRTRLWFAFYTLVLLAIVVFLVASNEWSQAATTLAIAVLFAFITRWFFRRR
jgi:hypothetical protein